MAFEFHLFRAKFIRPGQLNLFDDAATPSDLFILALSERPAATFRRNYTWHIGTPHEIEGQSGVFAVGRNSPTSIPRWDPQSGDFLDTEEVTGPHTFVVYDAGIGLMAIQKEADLAPTTEEIASKIERLFLQTSPIHRREVDVKIDPIPDPAGFVGKIRDAYAVKKFTATFTGPNPIDADSLFQRPLSVYLNAANGTSGSTTVQGRNLNSEVVVAVAHSTAATGNTATARIQETQGGPTTRVDLEGNPVKVVYEERPSPRQVLNDIRENYRNVRNAGS